MTRPRKDYGNAHKNKLHEAALARRREKARAEAAEKKALKAAAEAAEGQSDFAALVEAEKERMGIIEKQQSKAASKSPKTITTARENLTRAFDLMGGVAALVVWGRENPTEFYRLWARMIPRESVELSAQLPLESLLEKLSGHENTGRSVAEAAWEVGAELLEQGRTKAQEEDLLPHSNETIN